MNRKLKKLITSMILVLMIAVGGPFGQIKSWAADAKIAFSDPSVMVGNEVTVTMKVSSDTALGTAEIMLAYDPNILQFVSGTNANGGAGAIKVLGTMDSSDQKSFNFTLKFKTLQAGNTQISVTSQEIYDADSRTISLSKQGNSTVKVTSPATSSTDATLKSLKISPGTLTPAFSTSVETYTAQVDKDTTDLVVNAVASNAGASVALQGEKGLKAGENQVIVKVTAEDRQTVKNYTIKVTKEEGGEEVPVAGGSDAASEAEFGAATATINGTEYSIASSFDESTLPEGFEAETYQYKGNEVMAGKGLEKDIRLLYLKDAGGNGGFFIYNEEADSWSQFVQVETTSRAIIIVPLDSDTVIPEGFNERQVDIDGAQVTGWVAKAEAEPQYCLFYAMNWNGEKNFYRYDLSEKTIQRYFVSGVSNDKYVEMATTYNELTRDYHIQLYILIAVSALALILLIVVIVLLRKKNNSDFNRTRKDRFYKEPEEEMPSSRIKRYSRDEFDRVSKDAPLLPEEPEEEMDEPHVYAEDVMETEEEGEEDEEDDDFILETSLEEVERNLESVSAEEKKGGTVKNEEILEEDDDDDDFEFVDLEKE